MKLLSRTIKNYLLYSVLLVLLCTPLFYFSIQQLFVYEIDDELKEHKKDFYESVDYLKSDEDLAFFHLMNKEFLFKPIEVLPKKDTLFTQSYYDSSAGEIVPHRIFRTDVNVHGHNYELQIRESMVSRTGLIGAIMVIQIVMLTLLLTGLVLINRKLSKTIWDPFYVILDRLKKYQIEQGGELQLPRSSTAEFRDLSIAITQLVDRNREAYLNQKEFTENASHELQTPLAICQTKLELLAQSKELTQDQAELIGTLFNGMDRITRLNKNLLLLSKIENRQFFEMEEIDLKSVITKCLDTYSRQAQEKQITVTASVTERAFIHANPILIEVLINNLISNAIRHTVERSTVYIEATAMFVMISNVGKPFEQPEKMFQRFHRESPITLGSGLGLSIVKKISDVAGYEITYHYTHSIHHFKISF